ncbi:migration and invasion-inhibitory protein [Betta splendens]|uniref:Migration and invasion-inhibitory protein n=1 Tax=Betta splendens TaxID=158456 RepID=A0A6P7MNJ2_BETSP|nr:migration and invasion-inhibitory protein [Betta splendens]
MPFTDQVDALRERNKDLLNQLRQQRQNFEFLSDFSQSRRERKEEAAERSQPAEVPTQTLTDGRRRPARAALSKAAVRSADKREKQTGFQQTISTPLVESSAQHTELSDIYKDRDRNPAFYDTVQETAPIIKSCLISHPKEQREAKSRVTFQSEDCEEIPTDRHHLQPLLGYDWIAGLLDAEDSVIEHSDEFFNELRIFRSFNKDECVHSPQAEFSVPNQLRLSPLSDKDHPESKMDTHQCTFSYRINSRLFPVPLHSQECCPVCKQHKSSHPHTTAEPALIRVSIPCTTLLPPYKYKAHRRCSFDPSDSLALPSHCLSGWLNTGQGTLLTPSSLDLRSSLNVRGSAELQNKEVEALSAVKKLSNQITDVSCLARHDFRHFSHPQKLGRRISYHLT